jgi:hypothetical protein
MASRSCLALMRRVVACFPIWLVLWATPSFSATAGAPSVDELVIVKGQASDAVVVRTPGVSRHERLAAEDLAKYIEIMTGAKPADRRNAGRYRSRP